MSYSRIYKIHSTFISEIINSIVKRILTVSKSTKTFWKAFSSLPSIRLHILYRMKSIFNRKDVALSSSIDYSLPTAQFVFDMKDSLFFKKDNRNYINVTGVEQLNTLKNVSFLDIHLSKDNVIEPHYHQNAEEIVFCISGSALVSILNPFTKQLQHYSLTPGKLVNIPRGWWHYEVATADSTHLFAIFDAPTPEIILGSDLLSLTPPEIMAHTYCLDENQWKRTISPIKSSVIIGPPKDCRKTVPSQNQYPYPPPYQYQYPYQNYYGAQR